MKNNTTEIRIVNSIGETIYKAEPHVLMSTLIAHRVIPNFDFNKNKLEIISQLDEEALTVEVPPPEYMDTFTSQIKEGIAETQAIQKQLTDKANAFDNQKGLLPCWAFSFLCFIAGGALLLMLAGCVPELDMPSQLLCSDDGWQYDDTTQTIVTNDEGVALRCDIV